MKIILASKSPQRKKILNLLNLRFLIIDPDIDEKKYLADYKTPKEYCKALAYNKAKKVSKLNPNALVIGADTIIYYDNKIIGKPKNKNEATIQLKSFSGKSHIVYTCLYLINKSNNINKNIIDKTIVTCNKLNDEDIKYYVENFAPYERAGSYGIQEWSSIFIKKINGCYYNVVGFPLPKFYKLLHQILKKND